MKKTNKKVVALGVGSLVGLGMLSGAVIDMNAFEVEKVGNGDFVIPKNPIQLNDAFYNSYLNTTDYTTLRNKITSTSAPFVVKSTEEYADFLANQMTSNSPGFVASEVLDLKALGYTYNNETKILTNTTTGTTHNLGTAAGFSSIPKEVLLTNYGFDKLLEMAGKKERALYFYSKYGMATSYNANTDELTFRYTVIPYYIETIAETESRDLLVDSLVNMVQNESIASDKEKAYALYSYLSRFVTYSLDSNTSSHSGSSLALDYEAVCQAIAYVYQAAGEKLGLNMKYMVGTAGGENHAWNAIEIDGQWYYTDATWGVYKNNGQASTAKEDNYIAYSENFLFSDKKYSDRVLTDASKQNTLNLGMSFADTKFDGFTSYNGLGGGLYKDNFVVYKDNKVLIVDKNTAETKKELSASMVNHQVMKSAVVNNEYYQVFRNVSNNSIKIVVTNLETLETRDLAVIENSSMIGFVSNGMLIQDLNTNSYKVVLYSKQQQKSGTDKLFQIALDSSKLYYASDKALVDLGLSTDAISNRLSSFSNLVSIKDPVTGLAYETIDVDLEKDLEVKNFKVSSEGSSFTVSVEYGDIDKESLTDETVDFQIKSDEVDSTEVYVIEFTNTDGELVQKEVKGSVLRQGLKLSTLTGESDLLKDKESNSVYTQSFKVLTKDASKSISAYVSLMYDGQEIDKTTLTVTSDVLPVVLHTKEVTVTSEKVTMVIANATFSKKVTLKIGDEVIETTVKELMDGLVIDTKGQTVISVSLDIEDFDVIVTPVEEPQTPVLTTKNIIVQEGETVFTIEGLADDKVVKVVTSTETIETTVAELNNGKVFTTTEGEKIQIVVEGDESFTVSAMKLVVPVEPTEPENPVPTEPENPTPVEPVEPTEPTEPENPVPTEPISYEQSVSVNAGDYVLTIQGLEDSKMIKVVTATEEVVTTVGEVNAGKVFTTNGGTIQVIVEGTDSFSISAILVTPEVPVEPEVPVTPEIPEPVEPTTPDTGEVDEPTEPTEPVIPVEPTEPTEPTEPVIPVEPIEPTEPVKPIEPTEPTEPVIPVEPTEPTEPVIPVEPTEPVEPVKPIEPTEPETPSVPQSTEKDVVIESDEVVLNVGGLEDSTVIQVVTSTETIETTVGEVNAGKVFKTNGGTVKIIVPGDVKFTVVATAKVIETTPPVDENTDTDKGNESDTDKETDKEPEGNTSDKDGESDKDSEVIPTLPPVEGPTEELPQLEPTTPNTGGGTGGNDNSSDGEVMPSQPEQTTPNTGGGSGGSSSTGEVTTPSLPSTEGDGKDEVEDSETLSLSVEELEAVVVDIKNHYFEDSKVKNLSSLGTLRNIWYSIYELMEHVVHIEDEEVKAALIKDIEDSIIEPLINQLFADEKLSPFNMKTNGNLRTHSNMVYVYLNKIMNEVNPENDYLKELILEKQIQFIEESVWKNLKFDDEK